MRPLLKKSTLLILIFVNLSLIAGVIYFKSLVDRNSIVTISSNSESVIPYLKNVGLISLDSKAYIIYDTAARSVISGKNQNLRFAPASTAKIMAALIALNSYRPDQVLTARNIATISADSSKMGLTEGEQMTVINLIYGMMLPSGNDAAYVLAENYPGGVDAFVAKMNEKAETLKLSNTRFFDPDGYDDQNFTTAYDLARLGAYAIQNNTFAKIVATKNKTVYDLTGKTPHVLNNLNILLGQNGVTGIKTGHTDEAGDVLVTSINQGDRTYIVDVLNGQDRFGDTEKIIDGAVRKIKLLLY